MNRKQDVEKARFWQTTVREAAPSGLSIREFCRQSKKAAQYGVYGSE